MSILIQALEEYLKEHHPRWEIRGHISVQCSMDHPEYGPINIYMNSQQIIYRIPVVLAYYSKCRNYTIDNFIPQIAEAIADVETQQQYTDYPPAPIK